MKILHIEIHVNTKADFKVKEINIEKETDKQYKVAGGRGVVNKSKLLEASTIFRNSVGGQKATVNYTCYCLLEDEKKAKHLLFNKAKQRINDLNIGTLNLINALSEFNYR